MNKEIKIAILDAVPKIYWKDDDGITDAEIIKQIMMSTSPISPALVPVGIPSIQGHVTIVMPGGCIRPDRMLLVPGAPPRNVKIIMAAIIPIVALPRGLQVTRVIMRVGSDENMNIL